MSGLISIIGPPAAGKTTLAQALCEELPAELVREDYAGNPFLADSYAGNPEAQLPGQLYFLMSRVSQLSLANWPSQGLFVSDYGFCQDAIFARQRLSADDRRLYERVAARLEGLVRPPDVLVLLDASPRTLLTRIASRGREFEKAMDAPFLSAMSQAYHTAGETASCPVLHVDCDRVDLREPAARKSLLSNIRDHLP